MTGLLYGLQNNTRRLPGSVGLKERLGQALSDNSPLFAQLDAMAERVRDTATKNR
jgi:hypothetical protein